MKTKIAATKGKAKQAERKKQMLALCVAIGHLELVADVADTGDATSDIVNDLCAVAKEYAREQLRS